MLGYYKLPWFVFLLGWLWVGQKTCKAVKANGAVQANSDLSEMSRGDSIWQQRGLLAHPPPPPLVSFFLPKVCVYSESTLGRFWAIQGRCWGAAGAPWIAHRSPLAV